MRKNNTEEGEGNKKKKKKKEEEARRKKTTAFKPGSKYKFVLCTCRHTLFAYFWSEVTSAGLIESKSWCL